jgi:hypothetical protein
MELAKHEIINQASQIENITPIKLAEMSGFSDEELDFVKLFWEPAFNKSWIYLTKEMVVDWMGYKDGKDTMTHFYKQNLLKNYEENVDYKEVKKDDEIIKNFYSLNLANGNISAEHELPGNRAKYYIITGECLKCLLMSAQTPKGKIVRKIYIKTENLVVLMIEVVKQQQLIKMESELQIKDKQIETLEESNIKVERAIKELHHMKIDGYIYLITTKQYCKQHVFRLGRTESLNRRQRQHSSARVKNDQYFYVYHRKVENAELCELFIRRLLSKYREDSLKDMYVMPFSILKKHIDNIIDIYSNQIVPISDQVVDDVLGYKSTSEDKELEQNLIENSLEPYDITEKIILNPVKVETAPTYFEQIKELYKDYAGFEILTPKEDIHTMHDKVHIKCPHTNRKILVRTILRQIGCADCEKARQIHEIEQQEVKLENFADYKSIEIIPETTEEFESLKSREKIRIQTQNIIINKLQKEDLKLLSEYKNFDARFNYVCSFGHCHSTSWNTFKKLKENLCKPCRDVTLEKNKVSAFKHASEDQLKELATQNGFEYIKKSEKSGVYIIKCSKNHELKRYKRDFEKKCMACHRGE